MDELVSETASLAESHAEYLDRKYYESVKQPEEPTDDGPYEYRRPDARFDLDRLFQIVEVPDSWFPRLITPRHIVDLPRDRVRPLNRSGDQRFGSRAGAAVEQIVGSLQATCHRDSRRYCQQAWYTVLS